MPQLTSSPFEYTLGYAFPWKMLVTDGEATFFAVMFTLNTEDYPNGSSFAVMSGVAPHQGYRLIALSQASYDRVRAEIDRGRVRGDIEIHPSENTAMRF